MRILNALLLFLLFIIVSCKEWAKQICFEKETGITLDEFYDLLNSVYALRLDLLSSSHEKMLYINAGSQLARVCNACLDLTFNSPHASCLNNSAHGEGKV